MGSQCIADMFAELMNHRCRSRLTCAWMEHAWQARRAVLYHIRLCHVRCTKSGLGGTLARCQWVDETFDVHANCHKSVACVGNMRHRRYTPRCADVFPNVARQALHWTPSAFQVFDRHETFFPGFFSLFRDEWNESAFRWGIGGGEVEKCADERRRCFRWGAVQGRLGEQRWWWREGRRNNRFAKCSCVVRWVHSIGQERNVQGLSVELDVRPNSLRSLILRYTVSLVWGSVWTQAAQIKHSTCESFSFAHFRVRTHDTQTLSGRPTIHWSSFTDGVSIWVKPHHISHESFLRVKCWMSKRAMWLLRNMFEQKHTSFGMLRMFKTRARSQVSWIELVGSWGVWSNGQTNMSLVCVCMGDVANESRNMFNSRTMMPFLTWAFGQSPLFQRFTVRTCSVSYIVSDCLRCVHGSLFARLLALSGLPQCASELSLEVSVFFRSENFFEK